MIAHQDIPTEARRQSMQASMDAAKTPAERNRLGQFATPNALALDITRYVDSLQADDKRPVHFADPAVGSGSFFSAALAVHGPSGIASATGIEIDPAVADAARELWSHFGLDVIQADFTRLVATDPPNKPNLILANPPYVRHHHLDRNDKKRLQALTHGMAGVEVNGLAGLYVYFLLLATAWMEDDGLAAWLIPSEFMDVNYGSALREFLTDRVTLIRAHRFDPEDVQFGDALVSSVVLVFQKTLPPPRHHVEFSFGGTLNRPHVRDRIALPKLRNSRKWAAYPVHWRNDRRTSDNGDGPMLADLFRIQRGIATGGNKFFVLSRSEAQRHGLPDRYLRPILPSPRYLTIATIESDADGYPLIERQLCLIDCDLPEHIVEQRYPALWQHLQAAEAAGARNGYITGKRRPWYKQEQRAPAPFLCTYMGRGANDKQPFRFIHNRSLAVAPNVYLMLYPLRPLAAIMARNLRDGEEIHRLLGRLTAHELRGEGRVYGGGLNKIEPAELGRISAASFVERWPELMPIAPRRHAPCLFE